MVPALLRSASAASPAARSATGRTVTRYGPVSSTFPASSWSRITRCGSSGGRPWPIPAGPGLHRGGNGVDVAYRFLEPGTIAIHDDRWLTYPWGVNGGEPGARGRKWVDRADGTREVLPSKCHDVPVAPGDVLHFVTWGGGGWGDPLERDPALVALEVRRGLVTADGARRYGVVLAAGSAADPDATARLRDELRAGRPAELPVFDMGPALPELLARCEAETGLPAPRRPVWT